MKNTNLLALAFASDPDQETADCTIEELSINFAIYAKHDCDIYSCVNAWMNEAEQILNEPDPAETLFAL